MSWTPDHPGGLITCDEPGCTRSRRNYCTPAEHETWEAIERHDGPGHIDTALSDLCPTHATRTDLETKIRSL